MDVNVPDAEESPEECFAFDAPIAVVEDQRGS